MIDTIKKWFAQKGKPRSPHWPAVERRHLEKEGWCRYCGGVEHLQVHHVKPGYALRSAREKLSPFAWPFGTVGGHQPKNKAGSDCPLPIGESQLVGLNQLGQYQLQKYPLWGGLQ